MTDAIEFEEWIRTPWNDGGFIVQPSPIDKHNMKSAFLAGRRKGMEEKRPYLTEAQLISLNEKFGYFHYADAQGQVSRKFADAIIDIVNGEAKP